MATLQASRILEALQQARRVGRVEEATTIDGCPIVLQNLTPDDYDEINSELEGLEEVEYLHAFQLGHVCRSIVELGDQDLREVDFVEDEVPSGRCLLSVSVPKKVAEELLKKAKEAGGEGGIIPDGETRQVKLERHEWIRTRVLSTWGREALGVAWRKFAEVLALAEDRAKEGVQFRIPDESSEERYRRLLGEMKEVEEDLPRELVKGILDDAGYISKSTTEELEAVETRMRRMAVEDQARSEAPKETPPEQSQGRVRSEAPKETPPKQTTEVASPPPGPDPHELMRRRQPLNRQAVDPPVPRQASQPRAAVESAPVPEQLRRAAQNNSMTLGRSAQIAALEGEVPSELEPPPAPTRQEGVAELSQKAGPVDPKAVAGITDQPPIVGINPRYRPSGR